jgi:type IV secretory pathway VirJ component
MKIRSLTLAVVAALQLSAASASTSADAPEHVSHGRFADVALYRPAAEVKSFVLFLSGDGGWNQGVEDMARALAGEGALVAGVDVPKFLASFRGDGTSCVNPDGDLENLSHYLQGYAQLPTYFAPMLVGYSSGATLAYAMLAQAGSGTFAGALTLGFCPDLEIRAQPCHGAGLRFAPRPSGKGIDLKSTSVLGGPWYALHGEQDAVCDIDATRTFVGAAPEATMVSLPNVGHGYSVQRNWLPQLLDTYRTAAARAKNALDTPSLPGLPLVEMPTERDGDLFAVLVSGDGGWAGLDKEVAAGLVARGIPVVGLDSLRYFWKERTPDSFAADLDQILNFYADHWGKQRALVIGYSQGADVLPFALNRLSPDANSLVERSVLLAPAEMASFEFHLTNWIGGNSGDLPVKPEIERLDLSRLACVYGRDESDESPCATLGSPARVRALPGGHHFNGAYSELVSEITAGMSW